MLTTMRENAENGDVQILHGLSDGYDINCLCAYSTEL